MDLAFIKDHLREHRFVQLTAAVEGLETAIADGAVPNASFTKWKAKINLAVDESFNDLNKKLGDHKYDTLVMGAFNVRAALNEARRKGTPRIELLTKLMPLQDLLQSAKPLIVKREQKQAPEVAVVPVGYMTCQVCGRSIGAATGFIALHGYRRPGNSTQTKSCEGANADPYEASRDRLAHLIEEGRQSEQAAMATLADVEAERVPVRVSIRDYSAPLNSNGRRPTRWIQIARENAEEILAALPSDGGIPLKTFAEAKSRDLHARRARIGDIRARIAGLQQRHDGWKLTHFWDVATEGWKAIADLRASSPDIAADC